MVSYSYICQPSILYSSLIIIAGIRDWKDVVEEIDDTQLSEYIITV